MVPSPARWAAAATTCVTATGVSPDRGARARMNTLRSSAATAILAEGGSLAEIGQVLRHRRAVTTAAYTKVNSEALRALARPWPGASS